MLVESGAGDSRDDLFMLSLCVDLVLSGGGVEGTLISAMSLPKSALAIVILVDDAQVFEYVD